MSVAKQRSIGASILIRSLACSDIRPSRLGHCAREWT